MKSKILFFLFLSVSLFAREVIDQRGSCQINWTQGFILCEGESAQNQGKYAANLSAKVISQRNMLEVIKGVNITSEITIKSGLDSSEIIKSRVEGIVRGVQVISSKYDRNTKSSVVTTKLELGKDLLKALLSDPTLLSWNEKVEQLWNDFNILPQAIASTYTTDEKETILKLMEDLRDNSDAKKHLEKIIEQMNSSKNFTGVLLDISEITNFQKALIVKLVDEKGKEIYPSNLVSKQTLTKRNTSVGYMFGIDDAKKNKRVFDNPIEIKPSSIYKSKLSNIVLNKAQIEKINSIDKNVLKNAKIILVLGD
ncbi:hypothetical protein LPB137_13455 [Poseidonibacter parvus]|uniref:LPP20 lipoprotein n=1 Tax=Poseidonibacter parvus TaxID=1850254 RepID=A0A1P8KQF8_9BACT|nr:hypothetical protein [Poseidonibacter parvus]APW66794.1 hypothetical protein LPB137_13455 [Poseidonibacter parvus]